LRFGVNIDGPHRVGAKLLSNASVSLSRGRPTGVAREKPGGCRAGGWTVERSTATYQQWWTRPSRSAVGRDSFTAAFPDGFRSAV